MWWINCEEKSKCPDSGHGNDKNGRTNRSNPIYFADWYGIYLSSLFIDIKPIRIKQIDGIQNYQWLPVREILTTKNKFKRQTNMLSSSLIANGVIPFVHFAF